MELPHIPALRFGQDYSSLTTSEVRDCRSGEVLARVSQINAGIIRRDARRAEEACARLRAMPVRELIEISRRAADLFLKGELPVGNQQQSPEQYVATLSASSGLPRVMCRANMEKIAYALRHVERILAGLGRGLDLRVLDEGITRQDGRVQSFFPASKGLGIVLPSNSPGVNSLWLPSIALKTPVIMKPGKDEPWTPWRVMQALIAAGCPAEAFCFYPTDHEGAQTILEVYERGIIFGDASTVERYRGNPGISVHGPGFSKILIGDDEIEHPEKWMDVVVDSIVKNSGRSCVNASTVVVPRNGRMIAEHLARRLASISPEPLDSPTAPLSAFANPVMATGVDARISQALEKHGAEDLTLTLRATPRLVEQFGSTFLLPTVIWCPDREHALARSEFMFPFASVVEVPEAEMPAYLGPTLVLSAITENAHLRQQLLGLPGISRLNLGTLSTATVEWDQPHEGNLLEFLWVRRAIQTTRPPREAMPKATHLIDTAPLPVHLVHRPGAAHDVGPHAARLGAKRALIVTDKGVAAAGHLAIIEKSLRDAGLEMAIFDAVIENPTTACVEACTAVAREFAADVLIGLGGGSSLDTAKGCNFVYTNGGNMRDYHGKDKATRPMLPSIAIPTTAGTGSECQRFALITDPETHQKMACGDRKAAFSVALLDPLLTLTQPPFVAACTAMDALVHAIESAVTSCRTPLSLLYSQEAFRLINAHIETMLDYPEDIEARAGLQWGAALAGMAIEQSMLGAAHAAANGLTAIYGTTHGLAVGTMLPGVIRWNMADPDTALTYERLAKAGGLSGVHGLIDRVEWLLEKSGLRITLPDDSQIPQMAHIAAAQWTAQFNPRPMTATEFELLYVQRFA